MTVRSAALLATVLLGASVAGQFVLAARRQGEGAASTEGALAALGGLRSFAAEMVWFRADRLQQEGKYAELAQLASTLTALEPHTPEVWCYSAWNLAYNVSVMMPDEEGRWRWVKAGMSLLRDRGLALNPESPDLCRDLAWLFEVKIGADIDAASPHYRRRWRETVEDVARRDAWGELRMDRARMRDIERRYGFSDWTNPMLSAIYWAELGLQRARGQTRAFLQEIIRQSVGIYPKIGQM